MHECRQPLARLENVVYHMVDTKEQRRSIMAIAKVFRTGRSQAIRLPKEFRVDADIVHLKRTQEGFLVITKEPWEIFFEGVEQLSDTFLRWERVQPELESRD
jgi:antitoxin VapB